MTDPMKVTCVVHNRSQEPLGVVDADRALVLVLLGRAYVIEEHPTAQFRTVKASWPCPTRIVLTEHKKSGSRYFKVAQLSQRNLFLRDNHECQYCGRSHHALGKNEGLTRDHVIPLSRGGSDDWLNVVAACGRCNHLKDAKTPDEAGMKLRSQPYAPKVFEILMRRSKRRSAA